MMAGHVGRAQSDSRCCSAAGLLDMSVGASAGGVLAAQEAALGCEIPRIIKAQDWLVGA